jgi:hypothetical protein
VRYSIETVFEVTDETGRKYVIKFFPSQDWHIYRVDKAGRFGELEDTGRWHDEAAITPEEARAIVDEFRELRTLGAA